MNKLVIFGIGCIGSVLVKYLSKVRENQCFYFNRSDKAEVNIRHQNVVTTFPIHLSHEMESGLDWLIVCVKEYHYEGALSQIESLISPETKIAVFRNGLRLSSNFLPFVAQENILETIIDCPTQKKKSGEYIQFRKPIITVPPSALADEFINLFGESQIEFIKSENFEVEQWRKLIESASMGSIQAMTGKPCIVFKEQQWIDLFVKLVEEGIHVARSEGVAIAFSFASILLEKLLEYPDTKGSSMLSDKLAGNKIELNAKTGAILKIALKNKINVPTTQSIYNSLLT